MVVITKNNPSKSTELCLRSVSADGQTESEHDPDYDNESYYDDSDDLEASEEINLPEEDEDSEYEDDEDIYKRQMSYSYPPIPNYLPPNWETFDSVSIQPPTPTAIDSSKKVQSPKKSNTNNKSDTKERGKGRDRIGALTPMEEVTEPPSSSGTERSTVTRNLGFCNNFSKVSESNRSILKSSTPSSSLDRKVTFSTEDGLQPTSTQAMGNESPVDSLGSISATEVDDRTIKTTDSVLVTEVADTYFQKITTSEDEGLEKQILDEISEKVKTWDVRDASFDEEGEDEQEQQEEPPGIDAEFPVILDDMISELHSWDRLAGTNATVTEINASRQDHFAKITKQLASSLAEVSANIVMTNLPQLIPLLTTLLCATTINFRAQMSALNALNVFSDRLKDCKMKSGLKVLPNADLTWLIRTLCDISSESSRFLRSEGVGSLAKLVRASGPEMVFEPITYILMGNDEKFQKPREGSGHVVATGGPGGAPKIKAAALDTLTFALLTFPREDFNMEVVGKVACHCLLHPRRRVRQAALECLSVVAHAMKPNIALPLFRKYIMEEESQLAALTNSNSSISPSDNSSTSTCSCSSGTSGTSETATSDCSKCSSDFPHEEQIPQAIGPRSKIPVPLKVVEAQLKSQEARKPKPPSPVKPRGPTPSSAVSARVSRHILPSANIDELVEYGVKIPANCQLVCRQNQKINLQQEIVSWSNDENSTSASLNGDQRIWSASGESSGSISNIEYSFLELEPVLSANVSGGQRKLQSANSSSEELAMAPDIAWILNGTGPIKRCDPATMLPKDLSVLHGARNQQQTRSLGTASSSTDSDFISSVMSQPNVQRSISGSADFDNMRKLGGRSDILHDTIQKEPVLGRYFYQPNHMSPRSQLSSSDSLGSRYSSKATYNLLPNKYSITKHSSQHELLNHNSLLPGAYENPFGHVSSPKWSADLGKPPTKSKPLQPISSLRDKFFQSTKSDSQQSATSEDESETEQEAEMESTNKQSTEQIRSQSTTKGGVGYCRTQEVQNFLKSSSHLVNNAPREFQVYHSQIEMNPNSMATMSVTSVDSAKRGDADSAGSNHTRDSGVSLGSGSGPGSKTPPSAHNTPPLEPRAVPKSSDSYVKRSGSLNRNWRSTPDVPQLLTSDTDDGESNYQKSSTTLSNGRSTFSPGNLDPVASDQHIPVHKKPVLARRGQSVGKMPPIRYPDPGQPSVLVKDSGDHIHASYVNDVDTVDRYESSSSHSSDTKIRSSASTGSLTGYQIPVSGGDMSPYMEINENPARSNVMMTRESFEDEIYGLNKLNINSHKSPLSTNGLSKSCGKIAPKIYKGSYREVNSKRSKNTSQHEVFPADLKPVTSPKYALPMALGQLQSSDWDSNVDGFRQLVRMIRFNPEVIIGDLHNINMTAIKHLPNLRSQVCRAAILCFRELFTYLGRAMESDCEKIAEKLLDKAADTNKFIRDDSGKALEAMILNITPSKGITCLDLFGTRHRNPAVRCMTAKLTKTLVDTIGAERCLLELPERLLPMLCKLIQEGSLETRTHAKNAMSMLMTGAGFSSKLKRFVPPDVLRHAQKNIDALQK